jgi:hypothetical protein
MAAGRQFGALTYRFGVRQGRAIEGLERPRQPGSRMDIGFQAERTDLHEKYAYPLRQVPAVSNVNGLGWPTPL